jgi:hypothetical protein
MHERKSGAPRTPTRQERSDLMANTIDTRKVAGGAHAGAFDNGLGNSHDASVDRKLPPVARAAVITGLGLASWALTGIVLWAILAAL